MNGHQAEKWNQAMNEEMESLHKNQVWELVDPPADANVMGNSCLLYTSRCV